MVICLERVADLHMARLMPLLLTVFCFCKIQIGFTCLVPAHPGCPGKGPLTGCVCVCVKERSLQARLVELESQLSQSRSEVARQKRDKAEVTAAPLLYVRGGSRQ